MLELYEDLYQRKKEVEHDLRSANTRIEERIRLADTLRNINDILEDRPDEDPDSPVVTGDPLADEWEREIAAGRVPDLTKGMTPLPKRKSSSFIVAPRGSRHG